MALQFSTCSTHVRAYSVVLGLSIVLPSYAQENHFEQSQAAPIEQKQVPRFSLNTTVGNMISTEGVVLLPILVGSPEEETGFFYGHVAGKYTADQQWFLEVGLGQRAYFTSAQAYGINFALAKIGISKQSSVWMFSPGIEAIGEMWRASAHVYWPFGLTENSTDTVMKGVDLLVSGTFERATPMVGAYYACDREVSRYGVMAGFEFQINPFFTLNIRDTYTFNADVPHHVLGEMTLSFGAEETSPSRMQLPLLRHKVIPAIGSLISISPPASSDASPLTQKNTQTPPGNSNFQSVSPDPAENKRKKREAFVEKGEKLASYDQSKFDETRVDGYRKLLESALKLDEANRDLGTKVAATDQAQVEFKSASGDTTKKRVLEDAKKEEDTARKTFKTALDEVKKELDQYQSVGAHGNAIVPTELVSVQSQLADIGRAHEDFTPKAEDTGTKLTSFINAPADATAESNFTAARTTENAERGKLQAPITQLQKEIDTVLIAAKGRDATHRDQLNRDLTTTEEAGVEATTAGLDTELYRASRGLLTSVRMCLTNLNSEIDATNTVREGLGLISSLPSTSKPDDWRRAYEKENKKRSELHDVIKALMSSLSTLKNSN